MLCEKLMAEAEAEEREENRRIEMWMIERETERLRREIEEENRVFRY